MNHYLNSPVSVAFNLASTWGREIPHIRDDVSVTSFLNQCKHYCGWEFAVEWYFNCHLVTASVNQYVFWSLFSCKINRIINYKIKYLPTGPMRWDHSYIYSYNISRPLDLFKSVGYNSSINYICLIPTMGMDKIHHHNFLVSYNLV